MNPKEEIRKETENEVVFQLAKQINARRYLSDVFVTNCPFCKEENNWLIFNARGYHCMSCKADGEIEELIERYQKHNLNKHF
ncbi:hypothetical protein ADN00_18775 [Ornatilinea apprima]|uniref:Uncharacterized protein n=1 Tax=Ornatilinea apprima TaxID=1134406 RepID=A0A0P6X7F3_9CHLR|nr:CHC2 zinc finger domain-containing protein [Ornatilinea apprima]KPL70089.1 hypothetical protein ADN00_18775 [Ornatilinea apprima]